MASIGFTTDAAWCPTAMVYLKGRPRMVINKPWWDKLTPATQVFVIVHECLHAMLDHGLRNGRDLLPHATPIQINRAQDITINEMIESLFGIPRMALTDWDKYCWISTCFPGDPTILPNETFIYYLERLVKDNKDLPVLILDMHGAGDGDDSDEEELDPDVLDELFDTLTPEEIEKLKGALGRGPGAGLGGYLERKETKKKLTVAKLIRGMRSAASRMTPSDTFVTPARRFASLPDDMLLPNAHDSKRGNDKFLVSLWLDVSGSTAHLRPMFYELRELFLKEKDLLQVRSYVFADRLAEITEHNQNYNVGGGNAPFQIIEEELTKPVTAKRGGTKKVPRYPDCVIVITDGGAGGVRPKFPKRWLWLMTDPKDGMFHIPAGSREVFIKDVVFDSGARYE